MCVHCKTNPATGNTNIRCCGSGIFAFWSVFSCRRFCRWLLSRLRWLLSTIFRPVYLLFFHIRSFFFIIHCSSSSKHTLAYHSYHILITHEFITVQQTCIQNDQSKLNTKRLSQRDYKTNGATPVCIWYSFIFIIDSWIMEKKNAWSAIINRRCWINWPIQHTKPSEYCFLYRLDM